MPHVFDNVVDGDARVTTGHRLEQVRPVLWDRLRSGLLP